MRDTALWILVLFPWLSPTGVAGANETSDRTGSVIFVHPDGASAASWTAARALLVGPDGELAWDRLPHVAVYKGHIRDSLTATSNAGATVHAFGVKADHDAFGKTAGGGQGELLRDESGASSSVAAQALRAGFGVGLVQSGIATEPGTACFLAETDSRRDHELIAAQLIESGAHVLLSGGEQHFLPAGVEGLHGPGVRTDGRDLINEARAAGYAVVRTREELAALPTDTTRVLGLFAERSTFNDRTEEDLAARGLPLYDPDAPTLAEMTGAALRVLQARGTPFLLVVEEEGSDNFGNKNNASGVFEALRRADDTLALALEHITRHPNTLLMTTADSDGGGLRMRGIERSPGDEIPESVPLRDANGAPIDGVGGAGSAPFVAKADRNGVRLPFMVTWSSRDDVSGGVVVRAAGLHADRVRGTMDNTEIAVVIRATLFGDTPESER